MDATITESCRLRWAKARALSSSLVVEVEETFSCCSCQKARGQPVQDTARQRFLEKVWRLLSRQSSVRITRHSLAVQLNGSILELADVALWEEDIFF